jgi:hypothetical protein
LPWVGLSSRAILGQHALQEPSVAGNDTSLRERLGRQPYLLVCVLAGVPLGWTPVLLQLHGPIAEKFDVLYIQGSIAVWSYYVARMLIGFWIGITTWPAPWWLRGPLCGFLAVFPLTLISLAMPGCGWG